MNVSCQWRAHITVPTGTVTGDARQSVLGYYSGIAFTSSGSGGADTPSDRLSAMNVSCPWRPHLSVPAGTIGEGQRRSFLHYYSGLSWGGASTGKRVSCSLNYFMSLSGGDKIKVVATKISGTDGQTIGDSFRLFIKKA